MPELADVEGFRRIFERWAVRKRVAHVSVPVPDILRNTTPQGLGRALHDRVFDGTRRHGKWLIADSGDRMLVLHFGMTGALTWSSADGKLEHEPIAGRTAVWCPACQRRAD